MPITFFIVGYFICLMVCICALGQKQMWCNRVSACGWSCTSFDFAEALAFLFIFLSVVLSLLCRLFTMTANGLPLVCN